jgi:hypothetical protein
MNDWTKLKLSALFGFLAALGIVKVIIYTAYYLF